MKVRSTVLALLLTSAACASVDGPQQVHQPDAATTAKPDAGAVDAKIGSQQPDAASGAPDAKPAQGTDGGPVVVAVETIAPATATSGQKVGIKCELRDSNGDNAPWPASLVATVTIGSPAMIEDKGGAYYARKAGTTTVTCSAMGLTDATPATVQVLPGAAASVTTLVSRTPVDADPDDPGTDVDCLLRDAAGNAISDESGVTIALANPAAGTLAGAHVHFTLAGTQTVSCMAAAATTSPAEVEVNPGRPATIQLAVAPAQALYQPGVTVTAQLAVYDSYGNAADASAAAVTSSPAASSQPGALQFRYDAVGDYTLTARIAAGPISDAVDIKVNDGAPTIECTAQMIEIDGSTDTWQATHVSGRASDANGVKNVMVNGKTVKTDAGGHFTSTVSSVFGVNTFLVEVTDEQGVTRERWCPYLAAEAYQPEDVPPAGSVVLALGQDAIDDHTPGALANSLGDVVDRALTPEQLGDILHSYLDVGDRKLGRGCVLVIFCVDVYYDPDEHYVSVDTGNIDLDLGPAGMHTFLEATNFRLGIQSEGILGLASATGIAWVDSATVDADFEIAAVAGLLDGTYVDGSLATSFTGLSVDTDNFLVDLAAQIFPGLIDRVLNQVIQDLMAKIVDDLLHAIKVETFGISVVLPKLDGSGDVTVAAAGSFAEADADAERLRGSIAPVFVVTNGKKHAKASRGIAIQGGEITETAVPLAGRAIALGLHAEAVNDLVHKLWRYGFFDGRIDPDALKALGVNLGDLEDLLRSLDVSMSSPLPPVVEIRPNGKLRFGVTGMRTLLKIPTLETPLEIEVMGLFEGDATLTNGRITLKNITTLSLHIATLTLPEGIDSTTVDEFDMLATKLVETILGQVLAQSLLGIPVPELHLPTQIGPLTLPAPMTLGLEDPALTVDSPSLLIQSELLERP